MYVNRLRQAFLRTGVILSCCLYAWSLFLPVIHYTVLRETSTVHGLGCFFVGMMTLTMVWDHRAGQVAAMQMAICWLANPLFWVAIRFFWLKRLRTASVLGLVALSCAMNTLCDFHDGKYDMGELDVGYRCWVTSIGLVPTMAGALLIARPKKVQFNDCTEPPPIR